MRQKHGQNFLIDNNIANNILRAAELSSEDEVLEIGPGKGILTKIIQPQVKHLTAVEIDPVLAQQLKYYFSFHNINNVKIINADFLKLQSEEWRVESEDKNNSGASRISTLHSSLSTLPFKVISNLPYNVGTAIIQKILPLNNWTLCVLMLQKEVIRRLAANPCDKDYGYISIFCSYYADRKVLFDVSPKCFNPPPQVTSSVIKLTNKAAKPPDPLFFELVKRSFSMRRKTILNCLASFKNLEKSQANKILITCGLDPLLRPDKLSISDYLHLTDEIKKCIILQS
ncbi:MAG: 16S rRNA (adenine(1518)-N(6)/adenine(1519)-N(6))-dimethyltransferase RsmA [Endomicrobia bacterium]|nr:16S rRNA (adenine(1518)-N(6)/adenine(1519)-N(6))-dimethyltransferase RsmA [Endomicrobiia bacterium]